MSPNIDEALGYLYEFANYPPAIGPISSPTDKHALNLFVYFYVYIADAIFEHYSRYPG